MAFVVEDSTGVKGANSVITVQFFRDYNNDLGRDATQGTIDDASAQVLCVKGTNYADRRWGSQLKGKRLWETLKSRITYELSDNPSDGDTVTFGSVVVTFKTTASTSTQCTIGADAVATIENLATTLAGLLDDDITGTQIADPDVAKLTVFTAANEVAGAATSGTISATSSGKSGSPQPLEFPRDNMYDSFSNEDKSVPLNWQKAVAEYAWQSNSAELAPVPDEHNLTEKYEKVGPVEERWKYAGNNPTNKVFPVADALVQEFLISSGKVIRA